MNEASLAGDYTYHDSKPPHTCAYLWPAVIAILNEHLSATDRRVFEVGCGNGSFAHALRERGCEVTGIDPSEAGIHIAQETFPSLDLHLGSAYDDLAARFGRFPAVVSLEVVEHVYYPPKYASCVYDLLEKNGVAIISTPYHGYWKNLALAVIGQMDDHFTPLWTHGHIKFWSIDTLRQLLLDVGFRRITFRRVGRIPPLARSMIAIAQK